MNFFKNFLKEFLRLAISRRRTVRTFSWIIKNVSSNEFKDSNLAFFKEFRVLTTDFFSKISLKDNKGH